jgi:hypothetical protein
MVIAADRKQARVIMRYVLGLLKGVPMLRQLIEAERTEGVDLTCRVTIEVHTASFRSVRGYSIIAALCDEIAFWPSDDSASPDTEIIAALRPAMSTVPGAMMLCASSPYARRGALWKAYQKHYGQDGDPILVWQAATRCMNPRVPQALVDEAMAEDAAHAGAEYFALFRTDVESFVSLEAVTACLSKGVYERTPEPNVLYYAFCDPSGGSSDSMVLVVGHQDDDRAVLDLIREAKPPFSPQEVVTEFVTDLRRYNVTALRADRYAGEWPREQFSKRGIEYWACERNKSQLYANLLPVINSGNVALLDHTKLVTQLVGLERRTARGGKDSIDHAPGTHDDVANAVAGVVDLMLGSVEPVISLCPPIFFDRTTGHVHNPPDWWRR